jgi:hypothetical protein
VCVWSFLHFDEERDHGQGLLPVMKQYERCVYSQCTTLSESHACHVLTKKSWGI